MFARPRSGPRPARSRARRISPSSPASQRPASPTLDPSGPVQVQEAADRLRAPDRPDANALGGEIPAASYGERLHCDLVADTFDEHDCTRTLDSGSLPTRREP